MSKPIYQLTNMRPNIAPPESVINSASCALKVRTLAPFPESGIDELHEMIIDDNHRAFKRSPERENYTLICSEGLAILSSIMALSKNNRVAIHDDSINFYSKMLESFGFKTSSLEKLKLDKKKDKTSVCIIPNPSIPGGQVIEKKNLDELIAESISEGIIPIIDERFRSLGYEKDVPSARELNTWNDGCLIIDSLTHRACLQDFPISFVFGDGSLIEKINEIIINTGIRPTLSSQLAAYYYFKQRNQERVFQKRKLKLLSDRMRTVLSVFSQNDFYGMDVPEAGAMISGSFESTLPTDGVLKKMSEKGISIGMHGVSGGKTRFYISLYSDDDDLSDGISEAARIITSFSIRND